MAIQFYHRDDDGLPSYYVGTNLLQVFAAFKTIAKACLVTGYGAKPAAGWALVAEGSEYLVLRTGSGSGYVCFSYRYHGFDIWVAETYTGMSGNVMTGDGLKSGVAANNADPHYKSIRYFVASPDSHSWVVVADEKTAIFNLSGTSSSSDSVIAGTNGSDGGGLIYVGEDVAGNVIACGGGEGGTSGYGYFDQRRFTALKNPATGLLVDVGSISPIVAPSQLYVLGSGRPNIYSGVLEAAELSPVQWGASGVWSRFRGLCVDARVGLFSPHAVARALGLSAGITFRTLNTPLPLGDGNLYWVGCSSDYALRSGLTLIMTTNPEFW